MKEREPIAEKAKRILKELDEENYSQAEALIFADIINATTRTDDEIVKKSLSQTLSNLAFSTSGKNLEDIIQSVLDCSFVSQDSQRAS